MTEDTDTATAGEETRRPDDDKRFEVKWRKKSEGSTPPPQPEKVESAQSAADVAELQRQLEAERQRSQDLHDRWQRAMADIANLRRRTEQEKSELEQIASMLLVQELLPVLDNFERALATIPGNLQMLTWIQGVMLIERHLQAILERQGVQPIVAQGQPFNAYYHEAIAERETAEVAPGTVVQEYQRGYTMHSRVIRPSLVEVARAQSAPGEEQEAPQPESTDEAEGEEIAEEAETENIGP